MFSSWYNLYVLFTVYIRIHFLYQKHLDKLIKKFLFRNREIQNYRFRLSLIIANNYLFRGLLLQVVPAWWYTHPITYVPMGYRRSNATLQSTTSRGIGKKRTLFFQQTGREWRTAAYPFPIPCLSVQIYVFLWILASPFPFWLLPFNSLCIEGRRHLLFRSHLMLHQQKWGDSALYIRPHPCVFNMTVHHW